MALMSKGIVSGEMAWPLVLAGMFLAVALILVKSPSPMLIAVGMYLPFHSTAAIFVGGVIKWILEKSMDKKKATVEEKRKAENPGVLLSSGFIAGEALMAVLLALLYGIISSGKLDFGLRDYGMENPSSLLGVLVFAGFI